MEAKKGYSMWDVFEHILLFISLYVFVTTFTLLLHTFVDKWVPPTKSSSYSYIADTYSSSIIRGYLAAIIVSYPIFMYLFLHITKNTLTNPDLRKIRARKIMIYLTLVVTFIISLINIISIVYNLISGNVSFNFLFHFSVTFSISSFVFLYYLTQVKDDRQSYA